MRSSLLTLTSAMTMAGLGISAQSADPTDLDAMMALLKPTAAEGKWQEIAWRTDLWKAREEAAATGKPLYLWEMDGHPLGCT